MERLAGILWRLRRLPFFEAAILDARHFAVSNHWHSEEEEEEKEDEEVSDWKASVHFGRALIDDGRYNDALGKLARHESTLMNAFTKTLQTLLLLQEGRNSKAEPVMLEAVPLPSEA